MDKKLRKIEVIKKSTTTTTTEICQNWDLEPGLPSCGMLFSTGKVSFTMEWGSSHVRGDSKIKKCLILQKTTGGILKCTHKGRWLFRPGLYLFLIVFLILITEPKATLRDNSHIAPVKEQKSNNCSVAMARAWSDLILLLSESLVRVSPLQPCRWIVVAHGYLESLLVHCHTGPILQKNSCSSSIADVKTVIKFSVSCLALG